MYNTTSMLRTMEFLLGLRPMTHFDAGARPMTAAFQSQPDPAPVHRGEAAHFPGRQGIRPPRRPRPAPRSMNFEEADENDDDETERYPVARDPQRRAAAARCAAFSEVR